MNTRPRSSPPDRPFVLINMAMTADGKIATANRRVSVFGSAKDERQLYELRATVDAVMSGARTVDLNPVTLGNGGERFGRWRRRRGLAEHPLRVVVTGGGSLSPRAEIFRHRFSPIVVLTSRRAAATRLTALRRVADVVWVGGTDEVDLPAALRWLRTEWKVRRLLCEGGGELNDALFRAGVVDELHLTLCPFIVGGRTAPTICDGEGFPRLAAAYPLRLVKRRQVGPELFLTYVAPGTASPPQAQNS